MNNNITNSIRKFSIKVYDCREVKMPLNLSGKHRYEATIKATELIKQLDGWLDINPREATLTNTKAPIKGMKTTIAERPDLFNVCNRGLTITAKQLTNLTYSNAIELIFTNTKLHGLLDGGHTYLLLCDLFKKGIDINGVYLQVQILTGFNDLEEAVMVAGGRNTSTQVKASSLQNAKDYYEPIKQVLKDKPYADDIAYKETEFKYDESGARIGLKKLQIIDILAKLVCFNVHDYFDESHNPNCIYNGKDTCFKQIERDEKRAQIYDFLPLLPKILELFDVIYYEMPKMYNQITTLGLKEQGDKTHFGSIACVKTKQKVNLPFLGETSKYDIPKAMIYPILAAHRILITKGKNGYQWEYDPIAFFKKYGTSMVITMCQEANATTSGPSTSTSNTSYISTTVKRSSIWKSIYLDAKMNYTRLIENRIKKIS